MPTCTMRPSFPERTERVGGRHGQAQRLDRHNARRRPWPPAWHPPPARPRRRSRPSAAQRRAPDRAFRPPHRPAPPARPWPGPASAPPSPRRRRPRCPAIRRVSEPRAPGQPHATPSSRDSPGPPQGPGSMPSGRRVKIWRRHGPRPRVSANAPVAGEPRQNLRRHRWSGSRPGNRRSSRRRG